MTQPKSRPARPRRQHKGDRLLNPGASKSQIACDHALAPFDRAANEAERRWGVDRLPEVVSPQTAARYGRAIAGLNEAIETGDPDKVAAMAANCVKGIAAMEAEATANGAMPMPPKVIEFEADGLVIAIVQEPRDLQFYKKRPEVIAYTAREVAIVLGRISGSDGMIAEAKKAFPNAQITDVRPQLPDEFWENGGDAIKF